MTSQSVCEHTVSFPGLARGRENLRGYTSCSFEERHYAAEKASFRERYRQEFQGSNEGHALLVVASRLY